MSKMKIVCFGVRDYEVPTFEKLAKQYDYELVLRPEYLSDSCIELADGFEGVMVRGNCAISKENYKRLADKGLKYYVTRTAGFDHVNVPVLKELGIKTAFVPGYSPNAISELAVSLAMSLLRHTQYDGERTGRLLDFTVSDKMFSKEIRQCTVGVIGCGRIGRTTCGLFHGLGAKVIGYDKFPGQDSEILKYVDLDTLLAQSDVIVCHAAYFAGQNDNMISANEIAKMKDGVVFVNVARGELVDAKAMVEAVKSGKVEGFAADVLRGEKAVFNHKFNSIDEIPDPVVRDMVKLYPSTIITPHVASATEGALIDMVEVSLKNIDEFLATGECKNSLIK
jgi:D-lactate dehydrogenase